MSCSPSRSYFISLVNRPAPSVPVFVLNFCAILLLPFPLGSSCHLQLINARFMLLRRTCLRVDIVVVLVSWQQKATDGFQHEAFLSVTETSAGLWLTTSRYRSHKNTSPKTKYWYSKTVKKEEAYDSVLATTASSDQMIFPLTIKNARRGCLSARQSNTWFHLWPCPPCILFLFSACNTKRRS